MTHCIARHLRAGPRTGPGAGTSASAGSERGSATLMTVSVIGLLLTLGAGLGVATALFVDHRVAQAAADLAALAAADTAGTGGVPCAVAADIAEANRARLVDCAVNEREVRVTVVVEGPRWLGQTGDLTAQARAGPAP